MGPHGGWSLIPSQAQWVKGSGVAAAAVCVVAEAKIQSLARELPCSLGMAIKLKKTNKEFPSWCSG